ncbi:unnamed protein product [Ectocarpus sp. CCAP 1310/34]|nr:unnamed protein product [Ectocarpus sp. CCAP 1310/34]
MSSAGTGSRGRGNYGRADRDRSDRYEAPAQQPFRCQMCGRHQNAGHMRISMAVSHDLNPYGFDHFCAHCDQSEDRLERRVGYESHGTEGNRGVSGKEPSSSRGSSQNSCMSSQVAAAAATAAAAASAGTGVPHAAGAEAAATLSGGVSEGRGVATSAAAGAPRIFSSCSSSGQVSTRQTFTAGAGSSADDLCGVGAGDPYGVGASSSAASRYTDEEPMDEDEECVDGEKAPEEEAKEGDRERWMNALV